MSKPDLKDVTFVIPFHKDSEDRIENLECILKFIQSNFHTNIILVESYEQQPCARGLAFSGDGMLYIPVKQDGKIFHRTKIINTGIKACKTKYFCNYDTDVVFPIQNIVKAVEMLRDGVQVSYPYDGRFMDIKRSYITDGIIDEHVSFATESVGGAVFLNKDAYWKAGYENENIYGWGYEDCCRYARFYTLGYSIARTEGKCWHITHSRGINSSNLNPHDAANKKEYEKVKAMNKEALEKYISTWHWTYIPVNE